MQSNKIQLKKEDTLICSNNKHQSKAYYFCQNCAINKQPLHRIFYCKQCDMTAHMVMHKAHSSKYSLQDPKFTQKLYQFISCLRSTFNKRTDSFIQLAGGKKSAEKSAAVKKGFQQFFANQRQFFLFVRKEFNVEILNNPQPRNFMIKCKFWQFKSSKKQTIEKLVVAMGNQMTNSFMSDVGLKKLVSCDVESFSNQFSLNITKINDEVNILKQIQNTQENTNTYTKQLDLVNFLIEMYSSFSVTDCTSTLSYCRELIQKYPQQILLYYAQIRLLELIPKGTQKIQEVLAEITKIDKSFPSQAIAQWRIVDLSSQDKHLSFKNLFYQPKNQQYYKINNVDIFIGQLSKAISIQENESYFAARGIGYLIKGQIQKAENDLEKAFKLSNNHDSVINNYYYSQIKRNKIRDQVILQQLSNKSRQYIVNAAKYFKKNKKFERVIQCCQPLLDRQPKNQLIKVQLFKALIRGQNVTQEKLKEAQEVLEGITKNKNDTFMRYVQLQNKLKISKGRLLYKEQKFDKANEAFQEIGRELKQSATVYYNQAVINYQLEDYEQAQTAINKAIELKDKPKYRILKAYICCMCKDFDQAKEQFNFFESEGLTTELKQLKQFVQQQ